MKKFLFQVFLFGLAILVLTFAIGHIAISDEYIIHKTKDTSYEKIAWNINLLNNATDKIRGSVVFLGPSLIQGGICDSTLRAHNVKAINMGVNHGGNELELFFLEKVMKHEPKKVYLHLSKETYVKLHPMTPLMFSPAALLKCGQTLNVPFLDFIFKRAAFVLDYLVWKLVHQRNSDAYYSEFGVRYEDNEYSQNEYESISQESAADLFEYPNLQLNNFRFKSEEGMSGVKMKIKQGIRFLKYSGKNFNLLFNARCQQTFVMKAFEVGKENGVEVAEFYMPVIADAKVGQNFTALSYGERETKSVESLKDFSFLNQGSYWVDMNHLSKKGARKFTEQLLDKGVIR
jgi:hypothetical protein